MVALNRARGGGEEGRGDGGGWINVGRGNEGEGR